MFENKIVIPGRGEGRVFYGVPEEALKNCQNENFEAVFLPSIIDAKIEASNDSKIWHNGTNYSAPSIKVTGKTKQGSRVVIYAHVPNYFSDPNNIKKAKEQPLYDDNLGRGVGIVPRDEFQRLLSLKDDENVFVVDYDSLHTTSETVSLEDALKHPQTIPFLGGEERAIKYLERHREIYEDRPLRIAYKGDLSYEPMGHLLFVGHNYHGILGEHPLYATGRFLGVQHTNKVAEILT